MLKTEKSAKYALAVLMCFFALGLPIYYMNADYWHACFTFGLELLLLWGFFNPWILLERYSLFMFLDHEKMVHNSFAIVGGIITLGSAILIYVS